MSVVLAVLHKDLLVEWRARSRTIALASFALTLLLLFAFAIGPDSAALRQHAGAYLWMSVLLSSTLLLERSFHIEIELDALDSLLLVPVSAPGLFFGKAIANVVQLAILGALAIPLCFVVFDATMTEPVAWLGVTLILGVAGLAAPGTLYAALIARMSTRQLLLPLLLFPLVVPVLVATVKATSLVMLGDPMDQIGGWLGLLVCFDIVYWSLCGVLFSRVIEV